MYFNQLIQFANRVTPLIILIFLITSVCITFLTKFRATLDGLDNSVQSDHNKIEKELRKACKTTQPKDERFVSVTCGTLFRYHGNEFNFVVGTLE